MREIKFRAWFSDWKEMLYQGKGHSYDPSIKLNGDIIGLTTTQKPILMQSTGLLDKNGKEIYEGDIVQNGHLINKIIFDRGSFLLYGKNCMCHQNIKSDWWEIIGNIYENPELLK